MKKRTTISLNQEYLNSLKMIAVKQETTLSDLVNKAVRNYLSKTRKKQRNYEFFNQLDQIKENIVMDKDDIKDYIEKGRM